jgi:sortase A
MKKYFSTVVLTIAFLIGFSLILYPLVSDYVNTSHQSRVIASYEDDVSNLTASDYSGQLQAAVAYNEELAANPDSFLSVSKDTSKYDSLMNPFGNGIMGYIEIDSLDVRLPIYHGTSDSVLEIGAGHVEGSSLPVGGESTHCVLSGHRGLPSSKLFTDLDKMTIGDVFFIHTLGKVIAYQVDQILIVDPDDTSDLNIVEGKDYCTLVTCTPYGVNTQRLLVRGARVYYDEKSSQRLQVTADAVEIDFRVTACVVAMPVLVGLFIGLLIKTNKMKAKSRKGGVGNR